MSLCLCDKYFLLILFAFICVHLRFLFLLTLILDSRQKHSGMTMNVRLTGTSEYLKENANNAKNANERDDCYCYPERI